VHDTWTCHVCGKERPDARISVYSSTIFLDDQNQITAQQNVRYCNDNPKCVEAAKVLNLLKGE